MAIKLDIRHLIMIDAIDKTGSLAASSRLMNISQSALSHRIKEAERRLGVKLIGKRKSRAYLTNAGISILRAAQICLRELEHAEQIAETAGTDTLTTVRLGGSSLSGFQWLPEFLKCLERNHPKIELEVIMDVTGDPVAALRDRIIDIAIMPSHIERTVLESIALFRDEMVAVLEPGHPKAGHPWLDAEDFRDETYIGIRPGREAGREYERFFEPAGITPKRLVPAGSTETEIALVRSNIGIAFLTRWSAKPYTGIYDLKLLPLTKDGLFVNWHAIIRAGEPDKSPARVVAQELESFSF